MRVVSDQCPHINVYRCLNGMQGRVCCPYKIILCLDRGHSGGFSSLEACNFSSA